MGDGNGWARCYRGHLHWGRHGAAGMLVFHRAPGGSIHILLQKRARWCSGAGTWCMFGGGRHSHEDAVTAALRETTEECTLNTDTLKVHGTIDDDHGGWGYVTVVASVDEMQDVRPASWETSKAAWVPIEDVNTLRLFEPFAVNWPRLKTIMSRLVLVVDAANVVGARADGWWKDRAGAAARLRNELGSLAASGVTDLPAELLAYDKTFPEIVLILEGAARPAADEPTEGVRVIKASGSGDDAIVDFVSEPEPDAVYLVVTADRELRDRVEAAGASYIGPRWLLTQLS